MTVEEYIKKYTRNCSNELAYKDESGKSIYHPWLTPENAEAVAMIAREEKRKNLWKDAQGDDLPEIDREVIAFQTITNDELIEMVGSLRVVIAHRPNPEGWDGKSFSTGDVEHYTPKTYGKGGWNMEGITYWLDAPLPEGIE